MHRTSNVVAFSPAPAAIIEDVAARLAADIAILPDVADSEAAEAVPEPAPEFAKPNGDDALLALPHVVTQTTCTAIVQRAELAAAVAACTRAVEKRSTTPIMSNVLLREVDGAMIVRGSDLDMQITVPVGGAVDRGFETTMPAHVLADVLKKAKASEMIALDITARTTTGYERSYGYGDPPGGKVRRFKRGETRNVLDFDGLRVTLQGLPSADYPQLTPRPADPENIPDARWWSHAFTLPSAVLARALKRAQFAISTEESRYYLNGIYMHHRAPSNLDAYHGNSGVLKFVATDGHRMALCEVESPEGSAGMPGGIIPRKTVAEVLRLCTGKVAPQSVTVRLSASKIEVTAGAVTLLSKLIDGTFPDYQRVVPEGNFKRMTVDRTTLDGAVSQVTCISSERGRKVKLTMSGATVKAAVDNPDMGTAEMAVPCEWDCGGGGPMDIGFNSQYLREILAQVESDPVEFMLADPGSPTLIRGVGEADCGVSFVLMPMRV